jgi:S1-C subfamily serine protease
MPAQINSDRRDSVQEIFKVASQSVYWILRRTPSSSGSQSVVYGSAVAISEDLALTNCHVIGGPGDDAILGSGNSADQSAVELVAANVEADRCVVRTRDLRLRPVPGIRPFDSLEIGETVYAIGNPQRLELTMSDGLLSGKRVAADRRLVQTTAPISPGSSGGGLFDTRGNLVGITVSSRRDAQNINFAIPAEDFWR